MAGRPSTEPPERVDEPFRLFRGDSFGDYIIVERIGTGGMGVVLSAFDPRLDRKVALKLLRPDLLAGSEKTEAQARLLREARALAKVVHPNVITVHEVDTIDGQVYLAMEFCGGGTLREWLEAEPRTWREIVHRYIAAGRGLAAAHEAGLVHRDFKPENVLLDDNGRIRVTDFGLVGVSPSPDGTRALPESSPRFAEGSTDALQCLTRTGAVIGTPVFMAPEQHRGEIADARADQFAFCVALYMGLYGERPFAGRKYDALCENVLGERVRPAPRGNDVPPWLRRVLVKGLRADPRKRYGSMNELLAALARDPDQRRLRRSLILASAASAIALVLALLPGGGDDQPTCDGGRDRIESVWGAERKAAVRKSFLATGRPYAEATFERLSQQIGSYTDRWSTLHKQACVATLERHEQSVELFDRKMQCLSERMNRLSAVVDLIESSAETSHMDRSLEAVMGLARLDDCDDAAALGDGIAPPSDDIAADVDKLRGEWAVADAHRRLGSYKRAYQLAEGVAHNARKLGYAPAVAEALELLGDLQVRLEMPAAEATLREAAQIASESRHDEIASSARVRLVYLLAKQGRYDVALELAEATRSIAIRQGDDYALGTLLSSEGSVYHAKGDYARALELYTRARELISEAQGTADIDVVHTIENQGLALLKMGRITEAQSHLEHALRIKKDLYGPTHPTIGDSLNDLGITLENLGENAAAEKHLLGALEIRRAVYGDDSYWVGETQNNLGNVYKRLARYDEAERAYTSALHVWQKARGEDHPDVAGVLMNIGLLELEVGRAQESLPNFERALEILTGAYGDNHPDVGIAHLNIGAACRELGELDNAKTHWQRSLEIMETNQGPDHPEVADALINLGSLERASGNWQGALKLYKRAIAIHRKAFGEHHPRVATVRINMANLLNDNGKLTQAELNYEAALEILEPSIGENHPMLLYPVLGLGSIAVERGQKKKAIDYLERAVKLGKVEGANPRMAEQAKRQLAKARAL